MIFSSGIADKTDDQPINEHRGTSVPGIRVLQKLSENAGNIQPGSLLARSALEVQNLRADHNFGNFSPFLQPSYICMEEEGFDDPSYQRNILETLVDATILSRSIARIEEISIPIEPSLPRGSLENLRLIGQETPRLNAFKHTVFRRYAEWGIVNNIDLNLLIHNFKEVYHDKTGVHIDESEIIPVIAEMATLYACSMISNTYGANFVTYSGATLWEDIGRKNSSERKSSAEVRHSPKRNLSEELGYDVRLNIDQQNGYRLILLIDVKTFYSPYRTHFEVNMPVNVSFTRGGVIQLILRVPTTLYQGDPNIFVYQVRDMISDLLQEHQIVNA